ncbi:hypothetical protein H6P81_018827 [Aristolochia fimbriata]|uniref:Uncharacterized protein n=1 Tax=Aristolochia fimbriata TaxID=158543 RepID=A0AAV7E2D4_ARIFI|nr:hypothetical protein H6P81_018827 [Aristolochia fimbriata]
MSTLPYSETEAAESPMGKRNGPGVVTCRMTWHTSPRVIDPPTERAEPLQGSWVGSRVRRDPVELEEKKGRPGSDGA